MTKPTVTHADIDLRACIFTYIVENLARDFCDQDSSIERNRIIENFIAAHRESAIKEAVGEPVAWMYCGSTTVFSVARNGIFAGSGPRYGEWKETPLYAPTFLAGE